MNIQESCQLKLKNILNNCSFFVQWLLASARCLFCCCPLPAGELLCQPCHDDLPWHRGAQCHYCADSVPTSAQVTRLICGRCLRCPPAFNQTWALFRYEAPIAKAISRIKFSGDRLLAKLFSQLIADFILQTVPFDLTKTVIIPMPLHPKRQRQRGYNQAELLCQGLKQQGFQIDRQSCQRVKHTQRQSELPLSQRAGNIRTAFKVAPNFSAEQVLLVDDVMTSSETMRALAQGLRQQGVKDILILVLARACRLLELRDDF